jgi:hypothetical protein
MRQKAKIVGTKIAGFIGGFMLVLVGIIFMTIKSEILLNSGIFVNPWTKIDKIGFFLFGLLVILLSVGIFYWTGKFVSELQTRGTATSSVDIGDEYQVCGLVTVGKPPNITHFLTLKQGEKVTLFRIEGKKFNDKGIEKGVIIARTKSGMAKITLLTPQEVKKPKEESPAEDQHLPE